MSNRALNVYQFLLLSPDKQDTYTGCVQNLITKNRNHIWVSHLIEMSKGQMSPKWGAKFSNTDTNYPLPLTPTQLVEVSFTWLYNGKIVSREDYYILNTKLGRALNET